MPAKKIKLLHFIHGLNTGGAETLVKDYALHLDKEIFEITILCLSRLNSPYEQILADAGIKVIYLSDEIEDFQKRNLLAKIHKRIAMHRLVRKYIQQIKPDIIHYHLMLSSFLLTAGIPRQCKLFLTVHNVPERLWFNGNQQDKLDFYLVRYFVHRHNMMLIALHEQMRQQLMHLFQTKNVLQLNNGIDFQRFASLHEKKSQIRHTLGIPKNAFVVGHVGRFVEQKNHRFLVNVFHVLAKDMPNAFLLMIGAGEKKEEIEKKICSYSLQKRVLILQNRKDIPRLMKSMDVFVFPSIYEGLGIVLIEAQRSGLPCVISDQVPKAAEVTNLTYRLSLADTAEKWAETIKRVGMKKDAVISKGIENWDINQVCKKLEKFYLQSL